MAINEYLLGNVKGPSGAGKLPVSIIIGTSSGTGITNSEVDYLCTGTNDHTTINNALNAARAGSKIIFRRGTYNLSAPIILYDKSLVLEGESSATVFKCPGNAAFQGSDNVSITSQIIFKDFCISGSTTAFRFYQKASALVFDNITITGCIYGIMAGQAINNCIVRNCSISVSDYGFLGGGGTAVSNSINSTNCRIENSIINSSSGTGIGNIGDWSIISNTVVDAYGYGIDCGGHNYIQINNCSVYLNATGNGIIGLGTAFTMNGGMVAGRGSIINIGISIPSSAASCCITGVTLKYCNVGIYTAGPNATITGCHFYEMSERGMNFEATAANSLAIGNAINPASGIVGRSATALNLTTTNPNAATLNRGSWLTF